MARQVMSASDVKLRIESIVPRLTLIETEESWDTIATSIKTLTQICQDSGCDYPETLVPSVRSLSTPITSAIKSERTRLSGVAIEYITELATGLGTSFEPLLPVFFPTLLSVCARSNKVFVTRARACILLIIESTQLPSILPYFVHSIKDKSTSLRLVAAEGVLTCLNCLNPPDLEKEVRAREVENMIKATTRDANADVRKTGRKLFEAFKVLLPDRVDNFIAPLTPTIKKYLDIVPQKLPPPPSLQASTSSNTKSHMSRSMSALPASSVAAALPSKASKSTTSRPAPTLAHSASSSRAGSRSRTAPNDTKPFAPSGPKKGTMPPPDTIPTRPAQLLRHAGPPLKSTSASLSGNDRRPTPPLRPGMPAFRPATNPKSAPALAHSDSAVTRGPRREAGPSQHAPVPSNRAQRAPLPPPSKVRADESDNGRSTRSVRSVQQSTTVQTARPASNGRSKIIIGQKPELPQLTTKPSYADNKVKAKPPVKPVAKAEASSSSKRPPVTQKKPEKAAVITKPTWGSRPAKPPVPKHPPRSRSVPVRSRTTTPAIPEASSSKEAKDIVEEAAGDSAKEVVDKVQGDVESTGVPADDTAERVQEDRDHVPEPHPTSPVPSDHDETAKEEEEASDSLDKTATVEEVTNTPDIISPQVVVAKPSPLPVDIPATPPSSQGESWAKPQKTPISALLSSIEQGFLLTPASPLSPPISYLNYGRGMNDAINLTTPFPLFGISANSGSDKFVQPWPVDRQRTVVAEGENGGR